MAIAVTPITVPSGRAELAGWVCGTGPDVVCLHAGVVDGGAWRELAQALGGDHRVVVFDRRGYGATRYEPEPHDHVADTIAVMDHVGSDRAALVGNSVGGRVALETALTRCGLVLAAPAWTGGPYPEDPPDIVALGAAIRAADQAGDLEEVNRLEALVWLDGPGGPEGRVAGPVRDYFLDANRTALVSADPGSATTHPEVWPRLGELQVPVTVVEGARDEPAGLPMARAAIALMPDASLEVIQDVAHLPSLEVPDQLAEIVRALMARASRVT